MTAQVVLLKELIIAGYEGGALLAAFERLTKALALHGVPAIAVKPVVIAPVVRTAAARAGAGPFAGIVEVAVPPENAKAVARKAIAQSMLSPSTIALASHLIERFNLDTGRCDPGSGSLAYDLGISVRQVRRSVASLVASGLFGKARHGGLGFRNAYQPNWPLMVERAAEGDIAAKRPMLSAQAANVVTQNHLTKPDSDSMVVRQQRRRAAPVDRRQGHLMLPVVGGREASEEAVRSKLNRQMSGHLQSMGRAEFVEGLTRSMSVDWAPAIAAEMRRAGAGLPILLDALKAADGSRKATG